MSDYDFGFLNAYVLDDLITDINFNGRTLWLDHLSKGRYSEACDISDRELESFCYKFSNNANKQFNNSFPILESETDQLRISIIHKSVAQSGYSISIRKTPPIMRLSNELLVTQNYAPQQLLSYLKTLVEKRSNILISGLPGVGKTELVKYLTSFIPSNERVITIEDSLEIRYPMINPDKDGLMLKVNNIIDYRAAIKASLRQRPDWILLSEVRGVEVVELLESVSTGTSIISTIHAESASQITKRILHMFPGNEITNDKLLFNIHENINYGISLKSKIDDTGVHRYIDEVVKFSVFNDEIKTVSIYDKSKAFFNLDTESGGD